MALPASERIARSLEAAILARRYEQRLPAERELAAAHGVSRATVREAIGLLVARGLLTRRRGAGTYVNDRSDQQLAGIWSDMASRHPRLQENLIEFRAMLEREAAGLAAARHDAADARRLRQAHAEVEAAYSGSDRAAQIRSDVGFHRAIAEATRNPVFAYLMASLLKLLHEHVQLSLAGLAPQSAAAAQLRHQHRALLDAILARDVAAAERVASGHIEFVRVHLNDLGPRPAARH
ncbi:FadR/GntR family transcriptional regulator [Solimonas flava]|uniref:FadR/GntR family transcriptional regulator n=1 Tax=Solimonas flava TaxID=415849 RepID=UPI000413160F|nr:FCD domain-containing protein [Solimonas flava]